MLKIKPILTEKSMEMAKAGKYSFWVSKNMRKMGVKRVVSELFGVEVVNVRIMNYKKRIKSNMVKKGKSIVPARKKAIVTVKEGQTIGLFGEEDKKSKKKLRRKTKEKQAGEKSKK